MGGGEVEEGRMIRMENTRGWQCLAVMQCERSLYTRFCARCFAEVIPNPDGEQCCAFSRYLRCPRVPDNISAYYLFM